MTFYSGPDILNGYILHGHRLSQKVKLCGKKPITNDNSLENNHKSLKIINFNLFNKGLIFKIFDLSIKLRCLIPKHSILNADGCVNKYFL